MNSGDQVALAVDNLRPGNATNIKELAMYYSRESNRKNPFDNAVWVKNMIASNAIVPPHGESAAVRRTDYLVGLCVICLVTCGLVGFAVAYWWRA